MSGIPRAQIDEVITRWDLSGLPLIVVEGPYDQRMFKNARHEPWFPKEIFDIDVWTADAIEIPTEITVRYGMIGTGAKQRVISFVREVESRNFSQGFRGIVDRDLDTILKRDHSSEALIYTDFNCLECYFWNPSVLHKLITQFRCEGFFNTEGKISALYQSISDCCKNISVIRSVQEEIPDAISFSLSDKAFSMEDGLVKLDHEKFLQLCQLKAMHKENFEIEIDRKSRDIVDDIRLCINGHDLTRILSFCLKKTTAGTTRLVDEESVGNAIVTHGLTLCSLSATQLFQALLHWKANYLT